MGYLDRATWGRLFASAGRAVEGKFAGIGRAAEDKNVLPKADALWRDEQKDFALKTVHRATTQDPKNGKLWLWLSDRYEELGEETAAALFTRTAFEADPTDVRALAKLTDVARERRWKGELDRAYGRLLEAVRGNSELERDALAFFIPAKYEPGIDALSESKDPVASTLAKQVKDKSGEFTAPEPDDQKLVELLSAIIYGRYNETVERMGELPGEELPANTLYISARRYVRSDKKKLAYALLREFDGLDVLDGWARKQLEELSKSQLADYQLTRTGFPLSAARTSPKYAPNLDRSLYLLHNSLPYHSAGYATRTHGLLKSVRDFGWDIQGVTRLGYPFDMPKFEDTTEVQRVDHVDGVPYYRLSTEAGIEKKKPIQAYVGRYSAKLEGLIREQRPFVLHAASNHWNGLTAVETARRVGLPSVYEVRGLWEVTRGSRDPEWAGSGMYKFMARMEADAAKAATRVLTITNALKEELVSRGVEESKIVVLPNGVDTDRFKPREPDLDLKAKLGLSGKTVIGYVGSVLDYEGLGLLIDAAQLLSRTRNDFAILIVGDGAELEIFKSRVSSMELDEMFVFTGRVPHEEVESYYSIIDITPFPRLPLPVCEMVSPLKPFEAMAMQKAVVASDVKALAEIVTDGQNGLLHKKGSAESLAESIERLLVSPELREELAQRGRDWVVAERQWKNLGGIVSDIYLELGGKRSSRS